MFPGKKLGYINSNKSNSLRICLLNFCVNKYSFIAYITECFCRLFKSKAMLFNGFYAGIDTNRKSDIWQCDLPLAQETKNNCAQEQMEKYPKAAKAIIEQDYMVDYLGCIDRYYLCRYMQREMYDVNEWPGLKGHFRVLIKGL